MSRQKVAGQGKVRRLGTSCRKADKPGTSYVLRNIRVADRHYCDGGPRAGVASGGGTVLLWRTTQQATQLRQPGLGFVRSRCGTSAGEETRGGAGGADNSASKRSRQVEGRWMPRDCSRTATLTAPTPQRSLNLQTAPSRRTCQTFVA